MSRLYLKMMKAIYAKTDAEKRVTPLTGCVVAVRFYLVLTDRASGNYLYIGAFGSDILRDRAERYLIKKYRKDGYVNIGVSYKL